MKTLLVNCYLKDAESRLIYYRQMIQPFSEIAELKLEELNPEFDFAPYDAVVLTGSQWMLSERDVSEPVRAALRSLLLPVLGICFGHQLLARSFGAEVKRGPEFIDRMERIRFQPWRLFAGLGPEAEMRESHREYVTPESLERLGWEIGAVSPSCPVEAIRHPRLPLYGVQFHPERSEENGARLFCNFYDIVQSVRTGQG
ncbi:MAG: gamma-glutamyl-gamma-aminobutyrate hydrolase family protein [candidate division WOR-3 bacterium]|uniref:Glutamine amidotransferase domain-containing protein n=1 Tax=candidate division WOR-3 bacterium TaxID=2052148 RepID=A0A7C2AM14_UNCW3|nr:gamma-glutamyl-gamma-aminobutyrate hydrolase family protein [candidate division WOR-3 bacterium]